MFAVAISAVAYAFYLYGIYIGKVRPHAFSWFVWGLLTAIGFAAQVTGGGGPGAWVTGFTAAASFAFAGIGLTSGSRKFIVRSDWIFFIAALLALPPWYFTGNPLWSVIIITIIDAAAFVPTFRKAYLYPETESVWEKSLNGFKFIFGILALQNVSVVTVLYPASLIIMNGIFAIMVFLRRQKLANR